ncbi:MAG: sulfotransferase, partial [Thiohalobacterales bacterium]|nr:sulfotransferase [Thiohalobacterales bacterium]
MAPVIICGMHRSGTSLLCRTLESAGLFTGDVKEHNHEAVFFLTINQWIFEQHNASWDNTYNMRFINDDLDDYMCTVMGNLLNSTSASSFTGTDPHRRQLFSGESGIAWGWKDPRNTFTAPLWAELFPGARIIHVCRNPVDVADSLRRREQETLARHKTQLAGIPPEQLDGSLHYQQSPRLFHLGEG